MASRTATSQRSEEFPARTLQKVIQRTRNMDLVVRQLIPVMQGFAEGEQRAESQALRGMLATLSVAGLLGVVTTNAQSEQLSNLANTILATLRNAHTPIVSVSQSVSQP